MTELIPEWHAWATQLAQRLDQWGQGMPHGATGLYLRVSQACFNILTANLAGDVPGRLRDATLWGVPLVVDQRLTQLHGVEVCYHHHLPAMPEHRPSEQP
jgi:hypothetical protein